MSPGVRPRGPLPSAVYWRRRVAVLGVATLVLIGLSSLVGSLWSDPNGAEQGQLTGAVPSSSGSSSPKPKGDKKPGKTQSPSRPSPSGPCAQDDIKVEPVVKERVAGRDVLIAVRLSTNVAEACTWRGSAATLTMKITSGSDQIWTSAECPAAIEVADLVLRNVSTKTIDVVWSGRRSDEERCSVGNDWALPGFYYVAVAPLGGEPAEVQFELLAPEPQRVESTTAKD